MMETLYKELKETLDGLKSPFEEEGKVFERKFSEQEEAQKSEDQKPSGQVVKLEDIDVSYEPVSEASKTLNIDDE